MAEIIKSLKQWQKLRKSLPGQSLGFVPTMGAIHEGHLSLVKRSKLENDLTLVSIFVNPTQFNDPSDFKNYPLTLEKDLGFLEREKTDFVLIPEYQELYADDYAYRISENSFSHELCGQSRPGHFDGVLTVVMKLLNIARADRAYFGEKDYQQYLLVKNMTRAFFHETEIIACATVRENTGLAMSSRNALLNTRDREKAPIFFKILSTAKNSDEARLRLTQEGFDVDYVRDVEKTDEMTKRRFGAVKLSKVRLIDNVKI